MTNNLTNNLTNSPATATCIDTCIYNCIDVRSVLGESRRVPLHDGDGWPWYTCPWCSAPVSVRGAHPDHARLSTRMYACVADPGAQLADAVAREQAR